MSAVVLKTIIVILFLAVVASLSSGLWFLLRDSSEQKRTMLALGVRVTLARFVGDGRLRNPERHPDNSGPVVRGLLIVYRM